MPYCSSYRRCYSSSYISLQMSLVTVLVYMRPRTMFICNCRFLAPPLHLLHDMSHQIIYMYLDKYTYFKKMSVSGPKEIANWLFQDPRITGMTVSSHHYQTSNTRRLMLRYSVALVDKTILNTPMLPDPVQLYAHGPFRS